VPLSGVEVPAVEVQAASRTNAARPRTADRARRIETP
jgi:hypothetical protein